MVNTGARLMPKFTLIAEHTDLMQKPNGTKVSYDFHCEFLPEVLEHFELFLRGCGYCPTGTLDFIPNEEYYGESEWEPEEDWIDPNDSALADYPELKRNK